MRTEVTKKALRIWIVLGVIFFVGAALTLPHTIEQQGLKAVDVFVLLALPALWGCFLCRFKMLYEDAKNEKPNIANEVTQ